MCKHPEPDVQPVVGDAQSAPTSSLTVVIPTLNDGDNLQRLLPQLAGLGLAVVVSDGGSMDRSVELLLEADVHLVVGAPNRGEQLARGVAATSTPWILLLHSDSTLSSSALEQLVQVINCDEPAWGRFNVVLEPPSAGLRCIAWFMNQRSRLTHICTGDQGIFMHRSLLTGAGGIPSQPLMEDIELSKRLKATAAPFLCLPGPLLSSARRWRVQGVLRTVLSMWQFRLRYWLGASPEVLANDYYPGVQSKESTLA